MHDAWAWEAAADHYWLELMRATDPRYMSIPEGMCFGLTGDMSKDTNWTGGGGTSAFESLFNDVYKAHSLLNPAVAFVDGGCYITGN